MGLKKQEVFHLPSQDTVKINKDLRIKLRNWRKENGIFLSHDKFEITYISANGEKSKEEYSPYKCICELEDSLHLKEVYNSYDENKLKRIDKFRSISLKAIKADIGILEDSTKTIRKNLK
jgi:hypothetical protein